MTMAANGTTGQLIEKTRVATSNQSISGIEFLGKMAKNFLLEDAPEIPRLINIQEADGFSPFIAKGIVGAIVGAGGIGKTHYLTQLAIAVATGHKFLNKYPVQKTGPVITIYGENSKDDIHRLFRKTFKGLYNYGNIPADTKDHIIEASNRIGVMSVHGIDASFLDKNGNATAFYEQLLEDLKSITNDNAFEDGIALIIIDPVSRFLGPEAETNNAQATRFIALLEAMTQQIKGYPTVLFGHHMNKAGNNPSGTDQTAARGSSALTDGVRLQINLERVLDDSGKVDRTKIKQNMTKSNHTKLVDDETLTKDMCGCLYIPPLTVARQQNENSGDGDEEEILMTAADLGYRPLKNRS